MACTSSTVNFSQFTKSTKFKESQIKNFYLYFKKYTKESSNHLNYMEFKNSMGILGVTSNDYICQRLFDLLCDKKPQKLSFESYLKFMHLVNYGSIEEKITHSFKFFDLNSKGYILKDDFRKVIMSLCEYLASVSSAQMKIREEDVDLIFDEIMDKAEVDKLDLNAFLHVTHNNPEILDFFDIFNNKIVDSLTLVVHKESVKKIGSVIKQLRFLEEKKIKTNWDVTLGMKSDIEKLIKDKEKEKDRMMTHDSNRNLNTLEKENKFFVLSEKVINKFAGNTMEDDIDFDIDITDESESSQKSEESDSESEAKDYVYELDQVGKTSKEIKSKKKSLDNAIEVPVFELKPVKTLKENNNEIEISSRKIRKETVIDEAKLTKDIKNQFREEDSFDFIQPADISHLKDIHSNLLDNDIDINDCLIISNKRAFTKYIADMKDNLKRIQEEIDPSLKITKRRQGISLNISNTSPIDKDDFLNAPFHHIEEKGLIHFGNENVEMVLNMMIGIRNSVNSVGLVGNINCNINSKNNNSMSSNSNLFPLQTHDDAYKEVNRFKYCHKSFDKEIHCRFYDFAPKVFYNLRKLYGIKNEDYIKSLGPENFLGNLLMVKNRSLRELCSAGKSGSFFYYSYDSKFVLKTISTDEFEFFQEILEDYYTHMHFHQNTLLQRFFGLHTMFFNDIKMHFVIMNNVFNTNIQVHYKYDLKGSTFQRLSRKTKEINYDDYDFCVPMKDLDFRDRNEKVYLLSKEKNSISRELCSDADFLSSKNINDYSLLIGVHDPDMYNGKNSITKQNLIDQLVKGDNSMMMLVNSNDGSLNFNLNNTYGDLYNRKPFYEKHKGGILSSDGKKVYFFGIIDIFTQYGAKKKMEHFFKSITQGKGISCKPPNEYAERFKNFVRETFGS